MSFTTSPPPPPNSKPPLRYIILTKSSPSSPPRPPLPLPSLPLRLPQCYVGLDPSECLLVDESSWDGVGIPVLEAFILDKVPWSAFNTQTVGSTKLSLRTFLKTPSTRSRDSTSTTGSSSSNFPPFLLPLTCLTFSCDSLVRQKVDQILKESTSRHHSHLTKTDDNTTTMITHTPTSLTAHGIHLNNNQTDHYYQGISNLLNVIISSQLSHLFHLQSALVTLESLSNSKKYPIMYLSLTRQIARLHLELGNSTAYIKTWDAALLRLENVLDDVPTVKGYGEGVERDGECVGGVGEMSRTVLKCTFEQMVLTNR